MPVKLITYTGLLGNAHFHSNYIDRPDVSALLQQAKSIPNQLLSFKGILHVIDYTQRRHVGVSGPLDLILGYQPAEIMGNGLDFVIDIFHKEDFIIYNQKIFPQIVSTLQNTPIGERDRLIFSFTYRMRKNTNEWIHIYQQGSYITDILSGLPLFSIALVTDISPIKKDNSMVFTIDRKNPPSPFSSQNILTEYYNPEPEQSILTKRERQILTQLADGMSSKQIADKMYISEYTVVIHRKNMLKKTNSKNVAALIRFGILHGII